MLLGVTAAGPVFVPQDLRPHRPASQRKKPSLFICLRAGIRSPWRRKVLEGRLTEHLPPSESQLLSPGSRVSRSAAGPRTPRKRRCGRRGGRRVQPATRPRARLQRGGPPKWPRSREMHGQSMACRAASRSSCAACFASAFRVASSCASASYSPFLPTVPSSPF